MSVSRGATSVGIRVMRSYDNNSVFLRSESDGLFSELVNASVGKLRIVIQLSYDFVSFIHSPFISSERAQDDQYCICDMEITMCPRPNGMQSSKSGAAIGVAISVMCLGVTVIVVIAILCWWR